MDLFSVWHLLILLAIVLVLFGTSKLRNIGSDLGGAIKNFKQAVKTEGEEGDAQAQPVPPSGQIKKPRVIDAEATTVKKAPARSKKSAG
ncbi:MAG TPA: Sec-independent protein translocase subunit TatA [Acidiferrobacteraceae bacterium]|nr:Sec-independent protein translocase subunit TatA [Acidiferrobacteraceae bacterium]